MPNQPKTPVRNVRIPDNVWDAAKREAARRGCTVTALIREVLDQYLDDPLEVVNPPASAVTPPPPVR